MMPRLSKQRQIGIWTALLLCFGGATYSDAADIVRVGNISFVVGQVEIVRTPQKQRPTNLPAGAKISEHKGFFWEVYEAKKGAELFYEDYLVTHTAAKAVLRMDDNSKFTIAPNSYVHMKQAVDERRPGIVKRILRILSG